MDSSIWVAILSLLGTLLGSLGGIIASNRLVVYRIQELEKKVEKHNSVVDRVYKLENHEAVIDEEIEHLKEYHK